MFVNSLRKVFCPKCGCNLTSVFVFKDTGILSCDCGEYPLISGILYMHDNYERKRAVQLLFHKKRLRALYTLLDLDIFTLYPAYFFIFLLPEYFHKKIGFARLVKLLVWFGYPLNWVEYLLQRQNMPTFKMGVVLSRIVKKSDYVLELGCGVGTLLPILSKRSRPQNIIALDKSFFNLVLSRKYFAKESNLLICYDAERQLPFNSSSVDTVYSVDSLYNFTNSNKKHISKEVFRILSSNGLFVAIHMSNSGNEKFENIYNINANVMKNILYNSGFRNINTYSDNYLWNVLVNKPFLDLKKNSNLLSTKFKWYSVISAKSNFLPKLYIDSEERQLLLKNTNYKWDSDIKLDNQLSFLVNEYKSFYFLSPHFDDAILSCGMTIDKLREAKRKVTIITVFTKAEKGIPTEQARKYLKSCGFDNGVKLFKARKKEDILAAKYLGSNYRHLGFVDAAWRKNDQYKAIYDSEEKQFSGSISKFDKQLVKSIEEKIKDIIKNNKDTLVVSPIGIGGHADHIVIRDVARMLDRVKVLYWEDFPYNMIPGKASNFFEKNKKFSVYLRVDNGNFEKKEKAIYTYKSQINGLFNDKKITNVPEKFYTLVD